MKNTLAYCDTELITTVKKFYYTSLRPAVSYLSSRNKLQFLFETVGQSFKTRHLSDGSTLAAAYLTTKPRPIFGDFSTFFNGYNVFNLSES